MRGSRIADCGLRIADCGLIVGALSRARSDKVKAGFLASINPQSAILDGLVDIHLFSPHTSSGLRYAWHTEVDLILLLPDRLHPPCIINHRSARFTIYHIIYVSLATDVKVGAD